MKNFVGHGHNIQLIAPAGGVAGGTLHTVGSLGGIVIADAPEGTAFTLALTGIYSDIPKTSASTWEIGTKLFVETGSTDLATDGDIFIGFAMNSAVAGETTCTILLSHQS